jgi:transposase
MEAQHTSTDAPTCPGCAARDRRIAELEALGAQLEARIARLEAELARLQQQLEHSQRAGKRQAAPFSKGPPKANPKPPGRKPGPDYGTKAFRAIPDRIDEVHEAPLPDRCPHCGGTLTHETIDHQYQTEIPTVPIHRQFNIHVGQCSCCRKTVRGRHPLQTSNATGCCASQIGPNAQAAIVQLNKDAGLSQGKISRFFSTLFGIPLTRGGVCQAMLRAAGRCLPHYHQILLTFPEAPWIVPDETGWRVGGLGAWLHAFVSDKVVAYLIASQRGFAASSRVIPEDYDGILIHDGFKSYDRFWDATHQTCLAHLLVRSREMLEVATRGAVIFPRKVQDILHEALEIRDRRDAGQIQPQTAARHARRLEKQMVKLTEYTRANAANERFAAHLFRNQHHLFTFLKVPGIDATNYRAEQALKGPIVNRKVWGGNRTQTGAAAQSILCSVLGTAVKRGIQFLHWLSHLLCSPATAPGLIPANGG